MIDECPEIPDSRSAAAWRWIHGQGHTMVWTVDAGYPVNPKPRVMVGLPGTHPITSGYYDSCSTAIVALAVRLGWDG